MAQPGKDDALNLLRGWFERDLSRYARWDRDVEIHRIDGDGRVTIRIYTDVHWFSISAGPGSCGQGYLGCIAHTRKPRAGEDWTRGNDLRDGPLTEETWIGIMGDIISYEMVRIHREAVAQQSVNPKRGDRVVHIGADIPDSGISGETNDAGGIHLETDAAYRKRLEAIVPDSGDKVSLQTASARVLDAIGGIYDKPRFGEEVVSKTA